MASPATVVVGAVAALAETLDWFRPEAAQELPWCQPVRDDDTPAARAHGAWPETQVRTP